MIGVVYYLYDCDIFYNQVVFDNDAILCTEKRAWLVQLEVFAVTPFLSLHGSTLHRDEISE